MFIGISLPENVVLDKFHVRDLRSVQLAWAETGNAGRVICMAKYARYCKTNVVTLNVDVW